MALKKELRKLIRKTPVAGAIFDGFERWRSSVWVELFNGRLDQDRVATILNDSGYHEVGRDLADFTGLTPEQVAERIARTPRTHFKSEFNWVAPADARELAWYYRCSVGYLFGNAAHPYWKKLDALEGGGGRALDYGAGVGANVLGLAERGFQVDFVEINLIQQQFILFRARRRGLEGVHAIDPCAGGRFDPAGCLRGPYRAIVLQDVLEHIPDYPVVLKGLIGALEPGGWIFEKSPFVKEAREIDIHLVAAVPLEEAMVGMERIEEGIWRKR